MALESADERHLLRTIELAASARTAGNHPFGSLIVDASEERVVEAENTVVTGHDVTGHAELNVVRAASIELGEAGPRGRHAVHEHRAVRRCVPAPSTGRASARVVYALGSDTLAAIVEDPTEDSTLRLPCREVFARGGRPVEVSGPHLVEQASVVHAGFWV